MALLKGLTKLGLLCNNAYQIIKTDDNEDELPFFSLSKRVFAWEYSYKSTLILMQMKFIVCHDAKDNSEMDSQKTTTKISII